MTAKNTTDDAGELTIDDVKVEQAHDGVLHSNCGELTWDDLQAGMAVARRGEKATWTRTEIEAVNEVALGIRELVLVDGSSLWDVDDFKGKNPALALIEGAN